VFSTDFWKTFGILNLGCSSQRVSGKWIIMSQDFKDSESALSIDPWIHGMLSKKPGTSFAPKQESHVKRRGLGVLYAAFLGVSAMLIVILLGLIRCTDVDIVLINGSRTLLVYGIIGFIAGKIAEFCIREASKSMIREMLQRTDARQNSVAKETNHG
jgi:hypothetical protein